jgi:hypothetical protein
MRRREFLQHVAISSVWARIGLLENRFSHAQIADRPVSRIPTAAEIRSRSAKLWKLVDMINDYRIRHRLPQISLSPKLTAVAAWHVRDLAEQQPHERYGSLHSWSPSDRWTGGAYRADDNSTWPLMWDKPKEITGYAGYGFEICAAKVRDVHHALEVWQASTAHNNVILSRGPWADSRWQWQALGAVFYQGFACAWFGDRRDAH